MKKGLVEKKIGDIRVKRVGGVMRLYVNIHHPDTGERIFRNWEEVTFKEFFQFMADIRGKDWATESPRVANIKRQFEQGGHQN